MNQIHQYIIQKVGTEDVLSQLMEECAELAQATSKLRRCINGKNPTPVSRKQAAHNVMEEFADVAVCLQLLGISVQQGQVQKIMEDALDRI